MGETVRRFRNHSAAHADPKISAPMIEIIVESRRELEIAIEPLSLCGNRLAFGFNAAPPSERDVAFTSRLDGLPPDEPQACESLPTLLDLWETPQFLCA